MGPGCSLDPSVVLPASLEPRSSGGELASWWAPGPRDGDTRWYAATAGPVTSDLQWLERVEDVPGRGRMQVRRSRRTRSGSATLSGTATFFVVGAP